MEQNIVNSEYAFTTVKNSHGFRNKDEKLDSYYKEYTGEGGRKSYFRISNHLTYLWTWVKHGKALSRSNNICVTFVDEDIKPTTENTACDMNIYEKNENGESRAVGTIGDFEVILYVYTAPKYTKREISKINEHVGKFFTSGQFTDPYANIPQKHANGYILKPNQEPTQLQTAEATQNDNTEATTQQHPTNNKSVKEGLYHQYELMYKLGCISKDLFESMIHK